MVEVNDFEVIDNNAEEVVVEAEASNDAKIGAGGIALVAAGAGLAIAGLWKVGELAVKGVKAGKAKLDAAIEQRKLAKAEAEAEAVCVNEDGKHVTLKTKEKKK